MSDSEEDESGGGQAEAGAGAPTFSEQRIVIHRSAPDVAEEFAARLRDAGVFAEPLDHPGFLVLLATFGSYRVRIGVPPEHEEAARRAMASWDRDAAPRMAELTHRVRRQAAWAALPFLLTVLVGAVVTKGWDIVPWLACAAPAASLLTFLALALVDRSRSGRNP